jgi:hypothetical protein
MLNMVSGIARALYIVLAVVAGFVAIGMVNVPLLLVILGLIAGLTLPMDRHVLATVTVIALPIVGAALTQIPMVGDQLGAVMANLQLGVAGAVATAIAIRMYHLAADGVMGLGSSGGGTSAKKATA